MNMQKETERTQKLNPLTILYIVVALAVISVIYDYKVSVVCVIVMMLVGAGFGEFTSYLKLWSRSILWMCALCFVLQIFFIPGEDVIWKYGVFQVTREGLEQASKLCSRLFGAGSAAILGFRLIDLGNLMAVLEKSGISPTVTYVLMSTANIIPQMVKRMGAILEAQKSRGIEMESNMLVRAKAFLPSIGPLILNAIVNAEERAITLEARAFSAPCRKTSIKIIPDIKTDKIIRKLMIAAVILAIGGKIILWTAFK